MTTSVRSSFEQQQAGEHFDGSDKPLGELLYVVLPCVKNNIGDLPEWLQHCFLWAVAGTARNPGVAAPTNLLNLPNNIINIIGYLAGFPVTCEPPKREGEFCFKNTRALWIPYTLMSAGILFEVGWKNTID